MKQGAGADSPTAIPKIMDRLQLACSREAVRSPIRKKHGHAYEKFWPLRSGSCLPMPKKRAEYIAVQKFMPDGKIAFLDEP
jgi:hypothetical protein